MILLNYQNVLEYDLQGGDRFTIEGFVIGIVILLAVIQLVRLIIFLVRKIKTK